MVEERQDKTYFESENITNGLVSLNAAAQEAEAASAAAIERRIVAIVSAYLVEFDEVKLMMLDVSSNRASLKCGSFDSWIAPQPGLGIMGKEEGGIPLRRPGTYLQRYPPPRKKIRDSQPKAS